MKYVVGFEHISKKDVALAGGKGASLGEMTSAGIPVPPGFVITSSCFNYFLHVAGLYPEITTILGLIKDQDIREIEFASEKIQNLILQTKVPEDIMKEIANYFASLGSTYVAVRSSATAEDGSLAAWAGQLESYLNTTQDTLMVKLKSCWASLFTPRAIFYGYEKNLTHDQISVAVVIQRMVQSEIAGTAFSVHPVTEDHNQLIIEAAYGLGEAVVSGEITPDSYVVDKTNWQIIDISVNNQDRGLFKVEGGGNEWRDISGVGDKQKLTNQQINELAKLVVRVEKHYGFPCDIEWAFEGGKFYIVQSRPITTLGSNG